MKRDMQTEPHLAVPWVSVLSLTLGLSAGCAGRVDSASRDDAQSGGYSAGHEASPDEPRPSDVAPTASLCSLSIGESTFLETQDLLGVPQELLPGTLLVYDWGETEGRYIDESVEYLNLKFTFDPDERLEYVSGQGSQVADCIKAWEGREWNLLQHRKSSPTRSAAAKFQSPLDYAPLPPNDVLCSLIPGSTEYVLNGSDFGVDGPLPLFTAGNFEAAAKVREYRFGDLQAEKVSSIYLYFRHEILEDIVSYNLDVTPACWE